MMRHSKLEMTGRYTRPVPWISMPPRVCSRLSNRRGPARRLAMTGTDLEPVFWLECYLENTTE